MHKKNKNYWTFMFKYTNIELTVKRNKKQEGNKRMKGNVIVGQSGGPTAAINAVLPVYTGQRKTVEPIKYMECFTESRDY